MELGALLVGLGLSFYKFDLQWNRTGIFKLVRRTKLSECCKKEKGTVSAILIPISEFRMNSKLPRKQTK